MIKQITSKEHPLVKHLTHLRQNRDYRHECGRVLIEGEKLVKDVLKRIPYQHLIVSDHAYIPENFDLSRVMIVTEAILEKISGLSSPPRMMAEVDMPKPASLEGLNYIVALDRLQDPGNLGTLFRTAAALGWEGVFLIDPTVDPYNDKALRASQGASLFLPTRTGNREAFLAFLEASGLPAFAASSDGKKAKKVEKGCLILGQEGEGLDSALKERFQLIGLPMHQQIDSLNVSVAGGILMYLLRSHP
jgi:TrmH family RNA methyltransferase